MARDLTTIKKETIIEIYRLFEEFKSYSREDCLGKEIFLQIYKLSNNMEWALINSTKDFFISKELVEFMEKHTVKE